MKVMAVEEETFFLAYMRASESNTALRIPKKRTPILAASDPRLYEG